ncbi:hypothetical protein D3C87_735550 [compost metagenome]
MTNVIKKNGVNFGIILAVYFILRTALIYTIDLKLFVNSWFGFVDLIVSIILAIIAIAKTKKALGGFISFKEAFSVYFLTILIGLVIYSIFNIILFNVIDPAAKEIVKEHTIEYTVNMMKKFGSIDTQTLKETVAKLRETDSFSIPQQLLGLGISLLMYAVIGLIVAVAMRKNKVFE